MRTLKYIFILVPFLLFVVSGLTSCSEEIDGNSDSNGTANILQLKLELPAAEVISPLTKASQDGVNTVTDLNILIYNVATGDLDEKFYCTDSDNADKPLNGLSTDNSVSYNLEVASGEKEVYLIANAGKDLSGELSDKDQLMSYTAGLNSDKTPQLLMCAKGNPASFNAKGGATVSASLRRIYSMITVQVIDNVKGATITPTQVTLNYIPCKGSLFEENKIPAEGTENQDYIISGETLSFAKTSESPSGVVYGSHEKNAQAFLMYENMQGTGSCYYNGQTPDQTSKTPPFFDKPTTNTQTIQENNKTCSYIEVTTGYTSNQHSSDSGNSIKYRFFLGGNNFDNFDIKRNVHYKVTLTLSGDGGIAEGTWRVETDIMGEFSVEDAYIGFKQGSESKFILKAANEMFGQGYTWSIDRLSGDNFAEASINKATGEITLNATQTNVSERAPRSCTYRITVTHEGKAVSREVKLYQVTRILDPIGYYLNGTTTSLQNVEVKEFDKAINFYKTLNSVGAWTVSVIGGKDWIRLGKATDSNPDITLNENVIEGKNGEVKFTFNPKAATTTPRFGCIEVRYHNKQCIHKIYIRQGPNADVQLTKGAAQWAMGNVIEVGKNATYATQPGPLFVGGSKTTTYSTWNKTYNESVYEKVTKPGNTQWGNANTTKQGPCPNGYVLPSVRDFTVLRQNCYNDNLTATVGYLHDEDPVSGWSWNATKTKAVPTAQNHSNPAKGTLLINEKDGYTSAFFPYGNGVLIHENITKGHEQEYDNGLDEIGVGAIEGNGKLYFQEDYSIDGGSNIQIYEGYGALYWSGTPSTNRTLDGHMLYMRFWYFLNRNVPVYVSDGSDRWGAGLDVNRNNADGTDQSTRMFVRCVKAESSQATDNSYWNNNR